MQNESDQLLRLESADSNLISLVPQEGDESQSIPDSGISVTEKSEDVDVQMDFVESGDKYQALDENGSTIGEFWTIMLSISVELIHGKILLNIEIGAAFQNLSFCFEFRQPNNGYRQRVWLAKWRW